jgi:hypothetical protein
MKEIKPILEIIKSVDWFGFAPYGAGSPPALVLALNLHRSILVATAGDFWLLAAFTAGFSVVFTITIEAGTYKALAQAIALGERKAAIIAAIGGVCVTLLIIFGAYNGAGTQALITSSLAMIAGYMVIMLRTYMLTRQAAKAKEITDEAQKNNQQLEFIKATNAGEVEKLKMLAKTEEAKASGERAKARAAKAGKVSEEKGKVSETFGGDWRALPQVEKEYIRDNKLTVPQIMTRYRRSERTALNWQAYAATMAAL